MTMAGLAKELGISNLSLYHWIKKDPDRQERFAQARAIAADQWAEECLDIADQADGVSANADRLTDQLATYRHDRLVVPVRISDKYHFKGVLF